MRLYTSGVLRWFEVLVLWIASVLRTDVVEAGTTLGDQTDDGRENG